MIFFSKIINNPQNVKDYTKYLKFLNDFKDNWPIMKKLINFKQSFQILKKNHDIFIISWKTHKFIKNY